MNQTNGAYIVAWDFSKEDTGVLVVGERRDGKMIIVNAFQGKEAHDIYERLSTKVAK